MTVFEDYEYIEKIMYMTCTLDIGDMKMRKKESEYFFNYFLEHKNERLNNIDKWLKNNSLPTEFKTVQDMITIHDYLVENVETNGYPNQFFPIPSDFIFERGYNKSLPRRKITILWHCVLIDLAIKIGEEHIKKFPTWEWGIQDFRHKDAHTNGKLCLFSTISHAKRDHQEFINIMDEIEGDYARDLARMEEPSNTLGSVYMNLDARANGRKEFYLPFGDPEKTLTRFVGYSDTPPSVVEPPQG